MARKGYPFSKRNDKQMTNLISGLIAGSFIAPFAATDALSKNGNNKTCDKMDKKEDAVLGLLLGIFFLTPLYALSVYIALIFPLLGDLIFIFSTIIFVCLWKVIISDLIKASNKKEDTTIQSEIPPTE